MHYLGQFYGYARVLVKNINLEKLHAFSAFGLTIWQPRALRHPVCAMQATIIDQQPMCINARCLVMQYFSSIQQPVSKILTGMLSVLALPSADLMYANIYAQQPDLQLITTTVAQWQPQFILQLNMELPVVMSGSNVVRTFSPSHLLHNPQDKPAAYKALLKLRVMLHGAS